jgi:hypothetical protein
MHRVRHLKDKKILTFIEQEYQQMPTTPNQFLQIEEHLQSSYNLVYAIPYDTLTQFLAFLMARDGCHINYKTQILLKYIKQMNYKVTIEAVPEDAPKGKASVESYEADLMTQVNFKDYSEISNVPTKLKHAYKLK